MSVREFVREPVRPAERRNKDVGDVVSRWAHRSGPFTTDLGTATKNSTVRANLFLKDCRHSASFAAVSNLRSTSAAAS